jgi:ABC-2 type transport system ATP-binding protein
MSAVIEVSGLVKRYGSKEVVQSLDLEVRAGEVFAMLGPNGAGKTTTVEILQGLRLRTAGQVSVLGIDPEDWPRWWRDRVGIVPQSTGAFDDLRVREVVAHFAHFYAKPLPVAEVIELVGLEEKADAPCRELSGGQKRRVDVALAIVGDPELIFLDEPTTGLDPEVRREAWGLIESFRARGKTTLLTTHYLDEAEALADRVGIVAAGRIVATGDPASIGGRDASQSVISFTRTGSLAQSSLPDLGPGCEVATETSRVVVTSPRPSATVVHLVEWARALGVDELPSLSVHHPTLEDTYFRLLKRLNEEGGL